MTQPPVPAVAIPRILAFLVALSFPRVDAKARIEFKQVELNPDLPSDVFVLSVPGGVQ